MYGNNKYILYIVLRLMKIFLVIALLVPVLVMGAKVKPGPTPVPNNTVTNATYPVRFAYINRINSWWPPEAIAAGLGVPGYAPATIYNYIAFAFWTYSGGPVDIVKLWSDPITYFGSSSVFGSTKLAIQQNIKKKYNDNGIKLLISAFGAT